MKSSYEVVRNTIGSDGYHFTAYSRRQRVERTIYSTGRLETTNAYTASLWRQQGLKVSERVDVSYINL